MGIEGYERYDRQARDMAENGRFGVGLLGCV